MFKASYILAYLHYLFQYNIELMLAERQLLTEEKAGKVVTPAMQTKPYT